MTARRFGTLFCVCSILAPQIAAAACRWSFVPHMDGTNYSMNGVAKVSATDAWAVGARNGMTLTERWNGFRWTIVPSPNPQTPRGGSRLTAVAVVSANDVWAVGSTGTGNVGDPNATLTEHWNGIRWMIVPSRNVSSESFLDSIAAVSTNDVWAIGFSYVGTPKLFEHWDGARWRVINAPSVCCVSSIAAVSANDVWAVGSGGPCPNNNACTLTERWNGVRWSIVPSQNPNFNNFLDAVVAIRANDVWAVGSQGDSATNVVTLAEHWDGASWKVVPTPIFLSFGLFALAAVATNDVWAVGDTFNSQQVFTLTEHWDGRAWKYVPSPSASHNNDLLGVAALTSTDVLAVGTANDPAGPTNHALTLQYRCSSPLIFERGR